MYFKVFRVPPPDKHSCLIRQIRAFKDFKGLFQGFTLAEVLVTLGIIGVVAAMTMPSLIANHKEKETVARLKKFYSSISQSYLLAKEEYGTPDYWYTDEEVPYSQAASNKMGDILTKNMKILKTCYGGKGCFPDITYKKIDGENATNWDNYKNIAKYLTNDGYSLFFFSYGNQFQNYGNGVLVKTYGAISIDINGFKKPNIFGRDMFTFSFTEQGIVPNGAQIKIKNPFPYSCNRTKCTDAWCEGCAAWVIYNENMDYLHCDDLDWNGKTKCK